MRQEGEAPSAAAVLEEAFTAGGRVVAVVMRVGKSAVTETAVSVVSVAVIATREQFDFPWRRQGRGGKLPALSRPLGMSCSRIDIKSNTRCRRLRRGALPRLFRTTSRRNSLI